ncbi:hypothetical protein [Salinispora arenicola]|uniref:hypothetical protein n=1 Tax=Salinispora arenicola TaxID=168697 RepID=UPI0016A37C8A|nr:hypothetical protein [Salinispora arenicola]NIL64664.1 hypothetical protein [Salinispora arenicola]
MTARLKDLAGRYGEIRYTEAEDPVFSLHLTGIDEAAILDSVTSEYGSGTRRLLLRDLLWDELGVADRESFSPKVEVVWRGTKRTVGLVFGNVRDPASLADDQFQGSRRSRRGSSSTTRSTEGTHSPHEDVRRVGELQRRGKDGAVLCWLPSFLSEQWRTEVGRLARMRFLLGGAGPASGEGAEPVQRGSGQGA